MKKTKPDRQHFELSISTSATLATFVEQVKFVEYANSSVEHVSYFNNESLRTVTQEASARESDWIDYLGKVTMHENELISKLNSFVEAIPPSLLDDHCNAVFEKLKEKISIYLDEMTEDSKRVKKYPSQESLLQLFRYVYEIPIDSDLYIDHDSGFFGVNIRTEKDRLTFTLKDNREIIYSLVSNGAGISKFSGRGFIGKNKDSVKIKKIIGMTRNV